jgi:uncharacterized CHY-type Zn-finger protein
MLNFMIQLTCLAFKKDVILIKNVKGKTIDQETRCVHYHSAKDIISIKFYCCEDYYPCHRCHEETADHSAKVWPQKLFNTKAILCGACHNELSVTEYLSCKSRCPHCQAAFNPGCNLHIHLYFEV